MQFYPYHRVDFYPILGTSPEQKKWNRLEKKKQDKRGALAEDRHSRIRQRTLAEPSLLQHWVATELTTHLRQIL